MVETTDRVAKATTRRLAKRKGKLLVVEASKAEMDALAAKRPRGLPIREPEQVAPAPAGQWDEELEALREEHVHKDSDLMITCEVASKCGGPGCSPYHSIQISLWAEQRPKAVDDEQLIQRCGKIRKDEGPSIAAVECHLLKHNGVLCYLSMDSKWTTLLSSPGCAKAEQNFCFACG